MKLHVKEYRLYTSAFNTKDYSGRITAGKGASPIPIGKKIASPGQVKVQR